MASVLAPDGRKWTVGRQWLPRRVRIRRRKRDFPSDGLDGIAVLADLAEFSAGAFALAWAIAAVVVFLLLIVWPIVALALELVILLLLLMGGLAGRLTRRRPWRVVARTKDSDADEMAWNVKGWRASSEVIEEVTRALAAGTVPRPAGAERLDLEPGWYRRLRS